MPNPVPTGLAATINLLVVTPQYSLSKHNVEMEKHMDFNQFTGSVKQGVCPRCGGGLTSAGKAGGIFGGSRYQVCQRCDGIPALCNGRLYIPSGMGNIEDCQLCGQRGADFRTHELAKR